MTRDRGEHAARAWCVLYALTTAAWYVVWRSRFAERSGDEAIFENLLWNATHGNGLRCFVEGAGVSHLAVHFSPVLYLLCPLYALFPSMHVVHFVVSVATAVAGYALHRHAARVLDERAALPLMLAFLLHPTIVLQTFMEFHEQALAILPLVMLLIALHGGRRTATLLWAVALLAVREDNVLLVLALGALSLIGSRRLAVSLPLLALGAVWFGLWRVVSIESLGGDRLPGVFGGTYAQWGQTPAEVAGTLLSQPVAMVRHLFSPTPLKYLATLLAPFLFVLPWGSPLVLAVLPQLMMVLLATPGNRIYEIRLHFSVVPVVVLFFASIATLARVGAKDPQPARLVRCWAPLGILAMVLLLSPVWALKAAKRLSPFTTQIHRVLAAIPDTASVTAPGYLLNHLADRPKIALERNDDILHTEYVVLEDSSRLFFKGTTVDVFRSPHLDSVLARASYTKILELDGWHVYRRPGP